MISMNRTPFAKTKSQQYFVYILQSLKDQTYYVGYTQNLTKRLKAHNAGKSTYTKSHRPYKLIYQESFWIKKEAKQRELYLKQYANIKKFLQTRVPSIIDRD